MKFNDFLLSIKRNSNFPNALLISNNMCIDIDNTYKKYLKTLCCVKSIFCDECDICNKINLDSYADLVVLDADSKNITKDEIIDIQQRFSKIGLEKSNVKLYVIKNIENINKQSINSLLKFIEDSPLNTYSLFFTKNINSIIETISSRCQKIIIEDDLSEKIDNKEMEEIIRDIFSDFSLYKKFDNDYDFKHMYEICKNVSNKKSYENKISFINEIKKYTNFQLEIAINIISNFVDIEKKSQLYDLRKNLKLNLNKNILGLKIITIIGD